VASKSEWRRWQQSYRWRVGQKVRVVEGAHAGARGYIVEVQGPQGGPHQAGPKVRVAFPNGETSWYRANFSLLRVGGTLGRRTKPNPAHPSSTEKTVVIVGGLAILAGLGYWLYTQSQGTSTATSQPQSTTLGPAGSNQTLPSASSASSSAPAQTVDMGGTAGF